MAPKRKCNFCGEKFAADRASCPRCGQLVESRVRADRAAAAESTPNRCPACGAELEPRDIICIKCGHNLVTGEKIIPQVSFRDRLADFLQVPRNAAILFTAVMVLVAVVVLVWLLTMDYVAQGKAFLRAGKLDDATTSLGKAIRKNPNDVAAHYYMGLVHVKRQSPGEAINELKTVVGLQPKHLEGLLMLGLLLGGQGDFAGAANAFESYLAVDSNATDVKTLLGMAYMNQQNLDPAIDQFRQIIAANPNDGEAHQYLGITYCMKGQFENAIKEIHTALQWHPGLKDGQLSLGLAYEMADLYRDALVQFQAASVSADNNQSDATINLGLTYAAQQRYQDAVRQLAQVARFNPGEFNLRLLLGTSYFMTGQLDLAITELTDLLKAETPVEAPVRHQLGLVYAEKGDPAQAITELERAVSMEPQNPVFRYSLGILYKNAGRDTDAISQIREAAGLQPDNPNPHLALGILHAEKQNLNEAVNEMEMFIKKNKEESANKNVQEVLRHIKAMKQ